MEEQKNETSKNTTLHFYATYGNEENGTVRDTMAISETELTEQITDFPSTPFEIGGISRDLNPGEVINLVIEENYLCRNVTVLDYKEHPIPPSPAHMIEDPETYPTFEALLTDNEIENVRVVRTEDGHRIWIDKTFACLLEDMENQKETESTEKEEEISQSPRKKIWFWLFILAMIGIILWSLFVNN